MALRVISYGGGVQSTALLVLAVEGAIGHVDAAVFANVGDDSEHPASLAYVRDVAEPWAMLRGLKVYELRRTDRHGAPMEGLHARMVRPGSLSVPIPMRGSDTGAPGARACTVDWKLKVIGRWLLEQGHTAAEPAEVLIGFSLDEAHRASDKPSAARPSKAERCQRKTYPLLDLRLNRYDCQNIIARAGLPVPPKSSCYFCPYHKPSMWAQMRRDEPELFQKSADLETLLNSRRAERGKTPVFLTRYGLPLAQAIGTEVQPGMDFGAGPGETCDEGYCWT